MQFRSIAFLKLCPDLGSRLGVVRSLGPGEREIVPVFVGSRGISRGIRKSDALGAFQIRDGRGQPAGAHVKFTQIVVGVETVGLEFGGLFEFGFCQRLLPEAREVDGQVGARCGGVRLQTHGILEEAFRLFVPPLTGINQAHQLVHFKAVRKARRQGLDLPLGARVVLRFVRRRRGLELALKRAGASRSFLLRRRRFGGRRGGFAPDYRRLRDQERLNSFRFRRAPSAPHHEGQPRA